MPNQTRKAVIDAVIAAIAADTSIAGSRVYRGRHIETASSAFPVVYVWLGRDDMTTQSLTRLRSQMHQLQVCVDYWNKAASTGALEEAFDAVADAIEAAVLPGSAAIAGEDILLTTVEYLYDGEDPEPFGCARLTFTLKYLTTEPT